MHVFTSKWDVYQCCCKVDVPHYNIENDNITIADPIL